MDNRAGEMQTFARVAEARSFSEAARNMRMSPSTVSKLIARLEGRLGVRLLKRSTRHLTLTTEGQLYYERGLALIAELEDVEREVSQGAASTGGTVRVNASVALGVMGLEPLLPAFWAAYPRIVVDLSLSDELVDIYLDRTDVALRIGTLPNSGMMARRIGLAHRKIVASPEYLERHGTPTAASDLNAHQCLGFNFRRAAPVWPIRESGRVIDHAAQGPLLANNGDTVRRLALAGAGLARLADFHVREDMAAGRLIEVLADVVAADEEPIHAVFPSNAQMPQRVRVFLDFVVPRLQAFIHPPT